MSLDHGRIARHTAKYPVKELARVIKCLNESVVGEPGALVVEAMMALAGQMVGENFDGDEQIDVFCLAVAEMAKRRRRQMEFIEK